ncbi:MAG: hypothetical protein LC790_09890, partial [Actinobacteria bacterium]|nr:hypothetical protein [Actinomycetota bacterium]
AGAPIRGGVYGDPIISSSDSSRDLGSHASVGQPLLQQLGDVIDIAGLGFDHAVDEANIAGL